MAVTGDIIISVKPEHAHNIIVGRKTVELRRRFTDTSAIVLIYSSSPEKALIGGCEDSKRAPHGGWHS
jgi:predicted transcriptional regulator